MKTRFKKKNLFALLLAVLLTLRDYIFIFDENVSPIISITVYACLFGYFYLDIITRQQISLSKKMAITFLLILITVLCHVSSYPILTIFLFVYVLRNTNLEDSVSIFFWPRILMTILATILYELGMTDDIALYAGHKFGGDTFHTMGMSANPNTTAAYFFCAIMLCYLYGKIKENKILFLIPIIIVVYITKVTLSRTVLLSTIALYVFDLIFRSHKNTVLIRASLLLPFMLIALTFYLTFFGYENLMLNVLFSLRPKFWFEYFTSIGIFNYFVGTGTTLDVTIDSGFIWLFVSGGLLLYIPFFILLKNTLKRRELKDSPYFVFLLAIFTFSFMESVGMIQLRDITILLYLILYIPKIELSGKISSLEMPKFQAASPDSTNESWNTSSNFEF